MARSLLRGTRRASAAGHAPNANRGQGGTRGGGRGVDRSGLLAAFPSPEQSRRAANVAGKAAASRGRRQSERLRGRARQIAASVLSASNTNEQDCPIQTVHMTRRRCRTCMMAPRCDQEEFSAPRGSTHQSLLPFSPRGMMDSQTDGMRREPPLDPMFSTTYVMKTL